MANDPVKNDQKRRTLGERLAAAQEAKSAQKLASRGRNAKKLEDQTLLRAQGAVVWMQDHLNGILVVAALAVLAGASVLLWSKQSSRSSRQAGAELAKITDKTNVEDEDSAVLAVSYETMVESHPKTRAAAWARLGEGKYFYREGRFEEARSAYEQTLHQAKDEMLRWQALEGVAYTYEAEHEYEKGIEALNEMKELGTEIAPISEYQQGRLLWAEGKTQDAKERWLDALHKLESSPLAGVLSFTKKQIETRLSTLDEDVKSVPASESSEP